MSEIAQRLAKLSPEQQALLARKLRGTSPADAKTEPLAVIGIGCRFPGGGGSPDAFWRALIEGRDAVADVPAERWSADQYFSGDGTLPGRMNSRWGSWLSDLDAFDAQFFGLAPREAAKMDPQQRLVLEVCWEALEDAGQTVEGLAGSSTGVYVGTHSNDYAWTVFSDGSALDAYDSTGTAHSIVANRLSYLFDLRGPSLAVDTACSSSLVAVHLAAQGLRRRECDLAVASGVNVILSPLWSLALSKLGMLSPSGRCRTFDASADGIVRGEGCGAVVLKRLSDALGAGDAIWAVIRGSATNQDGRTNGLTAPNGLAQQAVVRSALADAAVAPEAISAIEAHGTGTTLGDPIEVEALAEVLGRGEASTNPCALGSVKTNVGHLEGAAGIAGLIKLVLSLHHERLPGLVHFRAPNPLLSLKGTRFSISAESREWPRGEKPRFGGVSAFGFGGANAHVVVEEAPRETTPLSASHAGEHHVLVVSARTEEALVARASSLTAWLCAEGASLPLGDVCATAALRRSRYERGYSVAGASREELVARLTAAAASAGHVGGLVRARRASGRTPGIAFVFTGQGTQWAGMGRVLQDAETAFREALQRCDAEIRRHADFSIVEEMLRPEKNSRLGSTEVAQPAVFAIQVALTDLWRSFGIVPDAVVGHSMGEVAAAHACGVLSLAEAARLIVHRARAMNAMTGRGSMLAVEVSPERALKLAEQSGLSVAAFNGPTSSVLSGETAGVEALAARLDAEGVAIHRLGVDYAFHSAQMDGAVPAFRSAIGTVDAAKPRIPMASTVSGAWAVASDFDAGYWARNIRESVRFRDAVDLLGRSGHGTFVEVGPHPALLRPVRQCAGAWEGASINVMASMDKDADPRDSIRASLGALHLLGHRIEREAVWPAGRRMVRLPPYPWQREHYPIPKAPADRGPSRRTAGSSHSILGFRLATAVETYEAEVSESSPAWLGDHRIHGQVLYPAAALLGAAWAAGVAAFGDERVGVEGLTIGRPLAILQGASRVVQVVSTPEGSARRITVFADASTQDGAPRFEELASARAVPLDVPLDDFHATDAAVAIDGSATDGQTLYARFAGLGAGFGPQFQRVVRLTRSRGRAVASVSTLGVDGALLRNPPLVDACLQVAAASLIDDQASQNALLLPVAIESAWCHDNDAKELRVEAVARDLGRLATEGALFDVWARDETGRTVLSLKGLHVRPSRTEHLQAPDQVSVFASEWVERLAEAPQRRPTARRVLFLPDRRGVAQAAADALTQAYVSAAVAEGSFSGDVPAGTTDVVDCRALDSTAAPFEAPRRVQDATEEVLQGALAVTQSLAAQGDAIPRLWFATRGALAAAPGDEATALSAASLSGFVKVAGLERPDLRPILIDLDSTPHNPGASALAAELMADADELAVALRGGGRRVARLARYTSTSPAASSGRRLERSPTRLIEEIGWVDASRRAPGPGEVEIRVRTAALNFRDVLNALGLYPGPQIPLGNECVGQVVAVGSGVTGLAPGDLVVAVAFASIADYVTTSAAMVVRKPATLSLTAASTLPIAFLTAHYALVELGRVNKGDRVLVHAGAGGVGLAAIQIALRRGATVFATAGSPEKRNYLTSLGVALAMDSRTTSFADEVRTRTGGEGVEVVLNSLAGDFIAQSVAVTARGGRFLELGKRDIWSAAQMGERRPDIDYRVVYLGEVCDSNPDRVGEWLQQIVDDVTADALRPLPVRVFSRGDAVEAFRYMAQARHVGKVALQIGHPESGEAGAVSPSSTHVVTGGLRGVGLLVAEWLSERGAAAVALLGRSGPDATGDAAIARMRARGTKVLTLVVDVTDRAQLAAAFGRIDAELPPLRGVWHAAGVLDDATIAQQTPERFARVIGPKASGAWNLHELTRERRLDTFVLFSSIASLTGWPGQSNYASANAFLDALAHHRRALGLPALSVHWGTWSGAGMAAALDRADQERLNRWGLRWMKPDAAMAAFERGAESGRPEIAIASLDARAFADASGSKAHRLFLGDESKASGGPVGPAAASVVSLTAELLDAPISRRRGLATKRVREVALRTLGLAPDFPLEPRRGLRDVGLDSLMAVELRNALQRMAERPLPATLLFDHPTVEALSGYLVEVVCKEPDRQQKTAASAPTAPEIAEDDAEALLREELAKAKSGGAR